MVVGCRFGANESLEEDAGGALFLVEVTGALTV